MSFDVNEGASNAAPGPETVAPTETGGPKRRGRPFGSTNRTAGERLKETPIGTGSAGATSEPETKARRKRFKPVDTTELAKKIQGTHMMLAMMTGINEMQITDMEATMLAASLADVAKEFDMQPNGKAVAVVQLLGTVAILYLPRIAMVKQKAAASKQHARDRAAAETAEVVPPSTPGNTNGIAGDGNGSVTGT